MRLLSRRSSLKAAGVSLTLPWLEAMSPAIAAATPEPPRRMIFVCTTLGLHGPSFWPRTTGRHYEFSEYLKLLEDHRDELTVFGGLSHQNQSGRSPHDSEVTWLTTARNPGFPGFRNTISVDQVAAATLGLTTRFPSLQLSSNNLASQSYDHRGVMLPARTSPAKLFAEMFIEGTSKEVMRQKQQLLHGRSVLDQLGEEVTRVRATISTKDAHLLDDYFESVRAVEKNISRAESWMNRPKPKVAADQPRDVKDSADLIGRVRLLMELIPLIVQTDSTRVITVMIQDHNVAPKIAGVTGDHHNLSHHGNDDSKIQQLRAVESGLVSCFGELLQKMKATSEADSNLLQQTSVLFGSNLGNANMHNTRNVPTILAGGGFDHGSFVKTKDNTPLSNLFVSMLQRANLPTDAFGQSNGKLTW